jgi:hypothetical protein
VNAFTARVTWQFESIMMRGFHMRWVDLLRSNVKGAKSRAEEQIERIRHALIIEYISSLGLSFVGNQQPLTRHAANEGCAEGFH